MILVIQNKNFLNFVLSTNYNSQSFTLFGKDKDLIKFVYISIVKGGILRTEKSFRV